jgi:hypothetical protein
MFGLPNIQGVPIPADDPMKRRQALADALMRQGSEMSYGATQNFGDGFMHTVSAPTGVPGNPPLATGVPRSMVRPGMPQPVAS